MPQQEHTISHVENIQERILDYIKEKGYQYNSILPKEEEMAQELGVSRVVVREAYSGLRSLGFIETKRKKGTIFIKPKVFGVLKYIIQSDLLDKDSIKDLYELRLMLEIGMADLVVKNAKDENIQELEELVEKEEQCENSEELKAIDIQFHTILYRMTENRSLEYFQHLLQQLFSLYTPKSSGWIKNEMMTHRTLVTLLKKKDVELFRLAMRVHLENQFVRKEKILNGGSKQK